VIVQFVTLPTGITYLFLFKPETLTACISHLNYMKKKTHEIPPLTVTVIVDFRSAPT
jgi:hypothetical protein